MHPDCSTCATCGLPGRLVGRGLCATCYGRAWRAGEIQRRPKKVKEPKRKPRVERICQRCGKAFMVPPSQVARYAVHCSAACKDSGIAEWRECERCGARFKATRQQVLTGNGRFCSQECWGLTKRNRVERHCSQCGSIFQSTPSAIAKGRAKYCCYACYKAAVSPALYSRKRLQTSAWRTAVLKRDGRRCQGCGATDQLQAHHIKPWARFPDLRYSVENGVTLCYPCHKLAHWPRIPEKRSAS